MAEATELFERLALAGGAHRRGEAIHTGLRRALFPSDPDLAGLEDVVYPDA